MRYQGKITNWNDEKGYGFVEPNGGGDQAFVHIKSFSERKRRPSDGDLIVYSLVKEKGGRFKATNIEFRHHQSSAIKPNKNQRKIGSIFTVCFCIFIVYATGVGKFPIQLVAIYIIASVITFLAYAIDKSHAQNNNWRTKESTLHLFGLMCGWPGAFWAQNKFRHKSKKTEFQKVYWLTVMLNVAACIYLLTESGAKYLAFISNPW